MKCVDLFCGCGGMTLGFEMAGFEITSAFDNWEPALEVYRKNFSHPVFKQDLTDEKNSVKKIRHYNPDIIIGGPPCQDFSSAGKRDNLDVNGIEPVRVVIREIIGVRHGLDAIGEV